MIKKDVARDIAKQCDIKIKDAEAFLTAFFATVQTGLKTDGIVKFIGFGTFKTSDVKEREGVNPRNPEEVMVIAAHKRIHFKAGVTLKSAINAAKKAKAKVKAKTKTKKKKITKRKLKK